MRPECFVVVWRKGLKRARDGKLPFDLEAKNLGNGLGTSPVDKFSLDLCAILVSADSTVPAVPSEGDPVGCFWLRHHDVRVPAVYLTSAFLAFL